MNTRWRDEFIARTARQEIPLHVARYLLASAKTLQRYAEAQCNGDYPFDNGERPVVPCWRCKTGTVKTSLKRRGLCPDCRKQDAVKKYLAEHAPSWSARFNGDPRGYVVELVRPGQEQEDNPEPPAIGVPS